jgi:hypothetical protein
LLDSISSLSTAIASSKRIQGWRASAVTAPRHCASVPVMYRMCACMTADACERPQPGCLLVACPAVFPLGP